MIRAAALVLATLLAIAGAASAQSITTGEGRQLQVPISPDGCTVSGLEAGQIITTLKFTCQVPDVDGGASRVAAAVEMWIVDASLLNPEGRALLAPDNLVRDFLTRAGRGDQVGNSNTDTVEQVRVSNGSVAMRCAVYDHIEELDGHALCLVNHSPSALVLYVDSTMAYTAMRGVEAVMADATLQ